jgi:hypothetical protein
MKDQRSGPHRVTNKTVLSPILPREVVKVQSTKGVLIMKLIDRFYLLIAHLIHGRDRSTINFDIDLGNADGYFICYRKEKKNGVEVTVRHEHPFYVDNRSFLRNKERILAARIITDAVKLGYNPQYVLFFSDEPMMPTPEQAELGINSACLFKSVYTQLGPIDPIEFAIEYAKYQKRVDDLSYMGSTTPKFDFTGKPSRFSAQTTRRALDIAMTPRGQTPLSLLTERYKPAHQQQPEKAFRTAVPFQPRIAFSQKVSSYRVSDRFPHHLKTLHH